MNAMNAASLTTRLLCVAATSAALFSSPTPAADWPDWRGPRQDRHYDGPPLVTSFDPEAGTNVLWKSDEAGGISTPVIIHGKLYTQVRHHPGPKEDAEAVPCPAAPPRNSGATGTGSEDRSVVETGLRALTHRLPAEKHSRNAVVAVKSCHPRPCGCTQIRRQFRWHTN